MVGRTLLRYRLLEQVGQGGMATVYRATDESDGREVAVKVLHRHLQSDPESRQRFLREAQAVSRLHHENILSIYGYSVGETDDSFLVTELVRGKTLRAFLSEYRPTLPEVSALFGAEVARALSAAHKEGVIHRDVKPENILLRDDGTLVLCDFGIARLADCDTLTSTGQLLGSPAYMAPEHIKGQPVDARSDLFALGVVMYELITGELPFRGKNPHETLTLIAEGTCEAPSQRQPLCSPELERVVTRALVPDPAERYQDAEELRKDLVALLEKVGVTDARAELRALLRHEKGPAAWEAEFRTRLRAALIAEGRALRKEGRVAAALRAFGRARQLDPEDATAQALIDSLGQGGRRRRLGLWVGGACGVTAIAILGGAALYHAKRRAQPPRPSQPAVLLRSDRTVNLPLRPPNPTTEPSGADSETTPRPVPTVTPAGLTRPDRESELRILHRRPHPELAKSAASHIVRLEPWPKAVAVTHNGRQLGVYGTDVRTAVLDAGRNEFVFENPACYSERIVLPPGATPEEVRVRLRWKPALLLVRTPDAESSSSWGNVAADVLIDGRLVGRSGQVVALPVKTDDGVLSVEVQVSAPGHKGANRRVVLHANQLLQVDLPLQSY